MTNLGTFVNQRSHPHPSPVHILWRPTSGVEERHPTNTRFGLQDSCCYPPCLRVLFMVFDPLELYDNNEA